MYLIVLPTNRKTASHAIFMTLEAAFHLTFYISRGPLSLLYFFELLYHSFAPSVISAPPCSFHLATNLS